MLFLLPLSAQEKSDTVYTFRFVPQKDMFYVPWSGNDTELARLEDCMKRYRSEILSGDTPLYVDGYCNSFDSEAENLATAKTRSNRVKSELIVRQKLTEYCFITRNHSGSGDYVTVRIVISADKDGKAKRRSQTSRFAFLERAVLPLCIKYMTTPARWPRNTYRSMQTVTRSSS